MESSPAHQEQSVRAFIAIPLPATFRQGLAELRQELERFALDGVRWVAPQNIHLTLKFLGDTPRSGLPAMEEALSRVVEGEALFSLQSQGLGAFPSWRNPRVIWAGLEDNPALIRLQHEVELALADLGFPAEERPFAAHLTLGRVTRPLPEAQRERLATFARDFAGGSLGTVPVDEVCLFQSQLRPTGPVYTCLFSARLGGTNFAAEPSGD
jgi:2'-5' RNA ligase